MTTTEKKKSSFLELTPEEMAMIERESRELPETTYNVSYTHKNLNANHGFGKINAFVEGNRLNPKLVSNGKDPNSLYIKKNQAILSKSKTGVTTYQWDFCGLKLKNKGRSRSML